MIRIDGSYMEGGGQILRTALALATLTGLAFRAEKIRHGRPAPGLKPQQMHAIQALIRMSGAQAEGVQAGSSNVVFYPGQVKPGDYTLDIGTAGSVTLLMQALLIPLLFAPGELVLRVMGGTDVRWSIPVDYFTHILIPVLQDWAEIEVLAVRRGFYPKGQGRLDVKVCPRVQGLQFSSVEKFRSAWRRRISALDLATRPEAIEIHGISAASAFLANARVAERQAEAAKAVLGHGIPLEIKQEYGPSASPGTVITLWAAARGGRAFAGGDALGEKGKKAEAVGREAGEKLLHVLNSSAAVDVHLADNLIPLLALAGGRIKTTHITEHMRSNIYVCEAFLGVSFEVNASAGLITV